MLFRFDFEPFCIIDNRLVADFLSATSNSLEKLEAINPQDCHDFSAALSSFNSADALLAQYSILEYLIKNKTSALKVIENRYGKIGLGLNLTRYCSQHFLIELDKITQNLVLKVIEKSNLFFNRYMSFFTGHSNDHLILISGVLTQLSQSVMSLNSEINNAFQKMRRYYPGSSALSSSFDLELDEYISSVLNFLTIEKDSIPFACEKNTALLLGSKILACEHILRIFLVQYDLNHFKGNTTQCIALCDSLRFEAKKLLDCTLFPPSSLEELESNRQSLCFSLYCLVSLFSKLEPTIMPLLTIQNINTHPFVFSNDLKRKLTSELIKSGSNPEVAENASDELLNYCKNHKITPKQIITSELNNIHPHLNHHSLQVLQEIEANLNFAPNFKSSKLSIEKINGEILKSLSKSIIILILLMGSLGTTTLFLTLSCGVKTAIRSDVEDFHPEIPIHQPLAVPTNKKAP